MSDHNLILELSPVIKVSTYRFENSPFQLRITEQDGLPPEYDFLDAKGSYISKSDKYPTTEQRMSAIAQAQTLRVVPDALNLDELLHTLECTFQRIYDVSNEVNLQNMKLTSKVQALESKMYE